jgi:hypothetical protein
MLTAIKTQTIIEGIHRHVIESTVKGLKQSLYRPGVAQRVPGS